MTIELQLTGADRLAATAHQAAAAIADLTPVNREAGDLVIGAIDVPTRTGTLAATVHVNTDAAGTTITAGGSTAPYVGFVLARDPFTITALRARRDAVVDLYRDALLAAVAHLKGT